MTVELHLNKITLFRKIDGLEQCLAFKKENVSLSWEICVIKNHVKKNY